MDSSPQTAASVAHSSRTLVIMAKAPKSGAVKTRLTVSLPSPAVTALYRCLLEDTLALATSLTRVDVAVMCPESDQDELACLLGDKVQVVPQKGEGLAAGLTSVFRYFTAFGRLSVIAFELSTGFTETFYDIDVANDLILLERELQLAPRRGPRTAAWFGEWQQAVAQLRTATEGS